VNRLDNEVHKLESERDKIQLKLQQAEVTQQKYKAKIAELESEVNRLD
jgi:predicted  nucleic acid-binding Zn-ribbon protein